MGHRSPAGQSCPTHEESLRSALGLGARTQVGTSSRWFSGAEVSVADTEIRQRLLEPR